MNKEKVKDIIQNHINFGIGSVLVELDKAFYIVEKKDEYIHIKGKTNQDYMIGFHDGRIIGEFMKSKAADGEEV